MIIRDDIDEARRLWAIAAAIAEAQKRATEPQVREANMALEKEAIQVAAMALRFLVDVCNAGK